MSTTQEDCQLCHKAKFKYSCPKCNILYCSVQCYKSQEHLKCSEQFYRSCIQEELTTAEPSSSDDMRKIYEILQRMKDSDAGLTPDFTDPLDSDDENAELNAEEENPCAEDDDEEEEEEDIAIRLQGVDINDADEVWQRLTETERADFKRMVECGEIVKLLPGYRPWWLKEKQQKIVELSKEAQQKENDMPQICENIPIFESICKKEPAACLHYNLWNIMAAYACVVRFFRGEQLTNGSEATAHLINLSLALKFGTNFEDVDDAIISVEMEALTARDSTPTSAKASLVETREQLQADARALMSRRQYKLAALSDILRLLQLAKKQFTQAQKSETDFHKLFAVSQGSVELDRKKIQHILKKIEFLLSYVNRDKQNDLV